MKKILALIMIICFAPMVFAAPGDVAVDGFETAPFNISHTVARVSNFSSSQSAGTIDKVGSTKLGSLTIRNNTRDGYEVSVTSTKLGVLMPATTEDGERSIPYSLKLTKTGDIGEGLDTDLDIESAELANADHLVISKPNQFIVSQTDCKLDIAVVITTDKEAQMELAGNYSDTITFTYTDK